MRDGIPGFYRDGDGETYYRSPHGTTWHYRLIGGSRGLVVECDFADIPATAESVYPDDEEATLVADQLDRIDPEAGEAIDPDDLLAYVGGPAAGDDRDRV